MKAIEATSAALTSAQTASTIRRSSSSAAQPIGHCRTMLPITKADSHSAPVSAGTFASTAKIGRKLNATCSPSPQAKAASMATGAARTTRHMPLSFTRWIGGADFQAGSSGRMTTSMRTAATRNGRGP